MQIDKLLFILIGFSLFFSCKQKQKDVNIPSIIPIPSVLKMKDGLFVLNANTTLSSNDDFKTSAEFLKAHLFNSYQIKIKKERSTNTISFKKDTLLSKAESYKIEINPESIIIYANSDKGAFYGVQTLRQILPATLENGSFKGDKISIPCLTIEDAPQYEYRGMHLDVSRHMYSVGFIKKYIDALALLKMNTFHWHLTDDQGWRIEIKKYPELNTIGAYRKETLIGHYNDTPHQFDGKKYGGFYTQTEIKELVEYAKTRHVTIIPEIEMPGHSQAVIAAFPKLGCTLKPVEVATKWGVFEEIYCTRESTFVFLENVLDEVMDLFPSKNIHIGGDEAPKTRWKSCKQCQNRMKTEGLKNEQELQSYFIKRIENYLNIKGRQIIGWDEILEGGLAPNATVMSWRGMKGAITAVKEKHNVIMTPTSHSYFDYYQSDNENEPLAIGGFLPLEKVYHFNPIPEELSDEEQKYVIGAQGNVWTEYMPTEDKVEYMVFPRMLAMSEVVWSKNENKNYSSFISRLEHFNKRLDILDIKYANHLYEVKGELVFKDNKSYYELSTALEDKTIYYTTNGSPVDLFSLVYKNPIPITENKTIKAAVFDTEKQLGRLFEQPINFHKAVGKRITLNVKPHKAYSGSGKEGLINGMSGSDSRYGDKEWLGFWGEDIEMIIDLGEVTEIKSIETRFYNANGQWLYVPKKIEIAFDNKKAKTYTIGRDGLIIDFKAEFNNEKGKIITLKIPSYGAIPEGFQGAGNKAWTFIDEIIVK